MLYMQRTNPEHVSQGKATLEFIQVQPFPSEISTVLHPERQTLNNEAGLENNLKIDVLLYSVVVCTAVEVD